MSVVDAMPETPKTTANLVIDMLEAEPLRFAEVARRVNSLPNAPRVRDYTDAEIDQLCMGTVRMVLEAARDEEPKFRRMFMEHAIPSFIREGETATSLLRWNASYLVLAAAALSDGAPAEHRQAIREWFAAYSGLYVCELLQAAVVATETATSSAA